MRRGSSTGTELTTGPAVAVVRRHASVAAVINDFYAELFTGRRDVPYPSSAVERALRS